MRSVNIFLGDGTDITLPATRAVASDIFAVEKPEYPLRPAGYRAAEDRILSCVHDIPVNAITDLRPECPWGCKIYMSPDFFFKILGKVDEVKEICPLFKIDKDIYVAISPGLFSGK
jgi:hypothetical protein